jgi:hypothetical protein
MEKRITRAMHCVLDQIGCDIAVLTEHGCIDAELAREMVLDASRLTTLGDDQEAAKAFYAMPRSDQDRIAAIAFPDGSSW